MLLGFVVAKRVCMHNLMSELNTAGLLGCKENHFLRLQVEAYQSVIQIGKEHGKPLRSGT